MAGTKDQLPHHILCREQKSVRTKPQTSGEDHRLLDCGNFQLQDQRSKWHDQESGYNNNMICQIQTPILTSQYQPLPDTVMEPENSHAVEVVSYDKHNVSFITSEETLVPSLVG